MLVHPFVSPVDFALIVHPHEVRSTVGTAWILRRSISNLHWFRSKGPDLDTQNRFLQLVQMPGLTPFLLFPGPQSANLSEDPDPPWKGPITFQNRPLFIILDGTWLQARSMLRKSKVLQSLRRVSFKTRQPSEYQFKKQPHPLCLSSVEGAHRVIEIVSNRGWASPPPHRAHDQMIEIFRKLVRSQIEAEGASNFSISQAKTAEAARLKARSFK